MFAVWECAPFIKVGGLGDVAHSLPKALAEMGVDMRVVIPHYKAVRVGRQRRQYLGKFTVKYAGKNVRIEVVKITFLDANVPVYMLANRKYLSVPNRETWGVFDLAVVKMSRDGVEEWKPEIIHCNDNHCGFIPPLLRRAQSPIKTVFTIHALHQKRIPLMLAERVGFKPEDLQIMHWEEQSKKVVTLLEGLVHADVINTVSPTYAKEILTEEYGSGLEDILRKFPEKISGILNGIDYTLRSPQSDKLHSKYDRESVAWGKAENKKYLQRKLGFSVRSHVPMIGYVGRLASQQKGVDLLHKMLLRINLNKYQIVTIGNGEAEWEEKFKLLASFNPKNLAYIEKYTDELAAQVYAACDFVVIPSRFEPCCLVQMNAMRYGAIPIAHATGGLKDTVRDGEDGWLYEKNTSHDLERAMNRAIKLYKDHPDKIHQMRQLGMERDFSWKRSAKKYLELYESVLVKQ